eukprot:Anaeramoba_ignava/a479501_179.p1 GENE.a479501_179~~a479501_179.p1  ORF type:complete len:321 (-),score=55.88 a479501_179:124-1056(-)
MEEKKLDGQAVGDCKDVHLPMDDEGRLYHIGLKRGELANRIITVGDPLRARSMSELLDKILFEHHSNRGYSAYTGLRNNVPISIIATGMGLPLVDFMVREGRVIVDGPMHIVRFGTCGCLDGEIPVGHVIVASKGSALATRDYDAVEENLQSKEVKNKIPYILTKVIPSDPELNKAILSELKEKLGEEKVHEGVNITADSFYSSQGRLNPDFNDYNSDLIEEILRKYPDAVSFEMETYLYLHLARSSVSKPIFATAACIALAQRKQDVFLDTETKHKVEKLGGQALIDALSKLVIKDEMNTDECVWKKQN